MKIKLWEKEEKDTEVYLRLVEDEEGFDLIICDKNGSMISQGSIIEITSEGLLIKYESINPELAEKIGIQLDDKRRIKEKT